MASVAQVTANRANAQKSTGPRTAQGKAIVAQNPVKHGLLAQRDVIQGEDPGEFGLFRDRMRQNLDPMGALEGMLADRVVNLAWRLRRAERLESAALDTLEAQHVTKTTDRPAEGETGPDQETVLARVIVEDFRYGKVLDRLLGYERRIENSLYRTMNELRKTRLMREVSEEVSSFKCRVSSEEGEESNRPGPATENFALQTATEPPCGVTTNGAQGENEMRQTNPEEVTDDEWQATNQEGPGSGPSGLLTSNVPLQTADASGETNPIGAESADDRASRGADVEEVGRGRPSYEEAPCGVAPNGTQVEGPSGETKPSEVTSKKSQVISQPG